MVGPKDWKKAIILILDTFLTSSKRSWVAFAPDLTLWVGVLQAEIIE